MEGDEIILECRKVRGLVFLCQPYPRKRYSLFPKWWCHKCKRWVLPDDLHKWRNPKAGEALMKIAVK